MLLTETPFALSSCLPVQDPSGLPLFLEDLWRVGDSLRFRVSVRVESRRVPPSPDQVPHGLDEVCPRVNGFFLSQVNKTVGVVNLVPPDSRRGWKHVFGQERPPPPPMATIARIHCDTHTHTHTHTHTSQEHRGGICFFSDL